jgi:hypothetical protein
MTRALASFLLLFWIVGLSLHLTGMIHLFMLVAVVALGCDLLSKPSPGTKPHKRLCGFHVEWPANSSGPFESPRPST